MYLDIFLVAAFAQLCLASWAPDKAARINFYTDAQCSAYNEEVAAWRSKKPEVALLSLGLEGNCIDLKMPGTSKSVNVAAMWGYVDGNSQIQNQRCDFFDDYNCARNSRASHFPGANCLPVRSKDGWLWKSAWCYLSETWSIDLFYDYVDIDGVKHRVDSGDIAPTSGDNNCCKLNRILSIGHFISLNLIQLI
jgi:hypothetical protein